MVGQSNFPEQYDDFSLVLTDIQASDIPNVNRYKELKLKANRTPQEETEFNNLLVSLRNKLFLPDDLNLLRDSMRKMQIFTKESILEYYQYRGEWTASPNPAYSIFNSVTYQGEAYLAIATPGSALPTDASKWQKIGAKGDRGLQGEQGPQGSNVVWRGQYNSGTTYNELDLVEYDGALYVAKQTTQGNIPTNMTYWDLFLARGKSVTVNTLRNTVIVNTNTSNVPIGISSFNRNLDALFVYVNSTYIERIQDYIINANGISIDKVSGTWNGTQQPITFNFVVIKNIVEDINFNDGALIQDGSITINKLSEGIQEDLNQIDILSQGVNNNASDISNLSGTVNAHLADYIRQPGYGTTGGSANTYTLTLNPALSSYVAGVGVVVKIHAANTGASTINVNGLGARSIRDSKGNTLTAGKLVLNSVYTLRYDGTNFILQGEGASGDATVSDLLSGKTATVDAGEIVGTMPNRTGHVAAQSSSRSGTTLRFRPQAGFYDGSIGNSVQLADANYIANNIRNGANIFGLLGTLDPAFYAEGTVSSTVVGGVHSITVSGLTFMPKVVVIFLFNTVYGVWCDKFGSEYIACWSSTSYTRYTIGGNWYVNSNGFRLACGREGLATWVALG